MCASKLVNPEDLQRLAEEARKELMIREGVGVTIKVFVSPLDPKGASRLVARAFTEEIRKANIVAKVVIAESEGASGLEPVVEIETPKDGVVVYRNITPDKVPIVVKEHLIGGRIVFEWLISQRRSQHMLFSWQ